MNREEQLDYKLMKLKALEQLRSDKSLYGKDGAFAPLLKIFKAVSIPVNFLIDPNGVIIGQNLEADLEREIGDIFADKLS